MKMSDLMTAFITTIQRLSAELEKYCKEVNPKDVKEHNTSFFEEPKKN